ncbi:MAG TPA: hypothetical protein VM347_25270 [Nonomuraea sp.]|nr:hypothetical protein [Nonomuraea sp.]
MCLHGVFADAQPLGDLSPRQLVDEPQREDMALTARKVPDELVEGHSSNKEIVAALEPPGVDAENRESLQGDTTAILAPYQIDRSISRPSPHPATSASGWHMSQRI